MSLASGGSRYEFSIHTYGCKVNTYDTGLLQKRLEALGQRAVSAEAVGLNGSGGLPRVHILNTCAVTAEATKEATKLIRRLKAKDPFATVVVTGCAAQVDGAVFDGLKGADLVVANSHKGELERILDDHFKGTLSGRVFRSNIFRKHDLEAGGGTEAGHTRSFLKIQDGCNSFCTYCVIPFARGRSRSIPVAEMVKRVRELRAAQNIAEVVLTGVHIGDYEDDSNPGKKLVLHDLVAEILAKTDVPRVRLTSLEPVELTPQLMSLFRDPRLCPHFHMSIQSANTRILQLMRRSYGAPEVETALMRIHEEVPHAFVGMDVIVGFPGEGEDEFFDTYERLSRLPWSRLHVFPYSERPGTKAASFDGVVPRNERALRSQRLRTLSMERMNQAASRQLGTVKDVLVLNQPARGAATLSRDYWPVILESPVRAPGSEMRVRIHGVRASQGGHADAVLIGAEAEGAIA